MHTKETLICNTMYYSKPPIVEPLIKGQCMSDLSIRDTASSPKIVSSYSFHIILRISENRTTSLQGTNQLHLYFSQSVPCLELYILYIMG